MKRAFAPTVALVAVLSIALVATTSAKSEPAGSFYSGRPLNLIVSFNAGGGADAYARLMARHLGRHIPGTPHVVIKNMPGAGGLTAANYLYNVSPRDGSEVGMFPGNIASLPLMKPAQVKYDVRRFNWIGSPATEIMLCVTSPTSPIKSFDDVFKRDMVTGTAGTATYDTAATLNGVLGTKLKIVSGYSGSAGLRLAAERGEIDGFCGVGYDSLKPAVVSGKLSILVQLSAQRSSELPDVPTVFQFASGDEQRQILQLTFVWGDIARPIAAPPEVPESRLSTLRRAFDDTVRDPAFLADAAKGGLGIEAISGTKIAAMIEEIYRTPRDVVDRAAAILKAR
jgi:tripartite-type tricarboxylate transporter receptor subunit TctC